MECAKQRVLSLCVEPLRCAINFRRVPKVAGRLSPWLKLAKRCGPLPCTFATVLLTLKTMSLVELEYARLAEIGIFEL